MAVPTIRAVRVFVRGGGVELNVRITRPDAPGRFPAVMEYHPYRRLAAALPHRTRCRRWKRLPGRNTRSISIW